MPVRTSSARSSILARSPASVGPEFNGSICAIQPANTAMFVNGSSDALTLAQSVSQAQESVIYQSAFILHVPGLTGVPDTISFESHATPGTFITHGGVDNPIQLVASPPSGATFAVIPTPLLLGLQTTFSLAAVDARGFVSIGQNQDIILGETEQQWMLTPSLALSRPVAWSDILVGKQSFVEAAQKKPTLITEMLGDPSVLEQFFNLPEMEDEQWGVVWAGMVQLQNSDNDTGLNATANCWGCRIAVGITFAVWGGAMIVAVGGFGAIAATGGFVAALGTALGVDLATIGTVISTASTAGTFVGWVNVVCNGIGVCGGS